MKKLLLSLAAMLAIGASAQEVSLDFTANNWGLPVSSSNGQTDEQTFTDGTYTITLSATTKYYYNTDGYLMLGKQGSTLTLPAFDFPVGKIEVTGTSGASASVKQNIYVGEEAVSTETTGAKDVTNVYDINPAYQAAGNLYTLKVTSAHNTQITAIKVYSAVASDEPVLTVDDNDVYFWNYTTTAWSDYQVNEQTLNVSAANLTDDITYCMASSGKTKGAYLENNVRFEVGNINLYGTNNGSIFVRVTSKKEGVYEDTILVKSGDIVVRVPVALNVAGTEGDGYWDPSDFCPLTIADANAIHAVIPTNASYMTDPSHKFNAADGDDGFRCFKGYVTEIIEMSAKQEDGSGYGNATFILKDAADAEASLQVYRCKGFDNALITDPEIIKVGDLVTVGGDICDYNGICELKTCQIIEVAAPALVPATTYEIVNLASNTVDITFTPNEATGMYYCCLFGEGELESQFTFFGAWMGFSNYGDMIKAWGFANSGVQTKTWKDLQPDTNYEVWVLPTDLEGNYGELQCVTFTTAKQGGEGAAVIAIEIGEFGGSEETGYWQYVTYTPNDQTAVFFDLICTDEFYLARGKEGVIDFLKEEDNPSDPYYSYYAQFSTDDARWNAEPGTTYHACAIGKNALGEWGELTEVVFTTPGTTVAIESVKSNKAATGIYNLNGMKTRENGLIIRDGRVVLVK